jgi:hypothetical protein
MGDNEHSFTVEQYRAAMAEQSRLKSEKDEAQRQEHMAKAAENRALDQLRGAVEALREIVDTWDNPGPAARQDVRYQHCVRLARATLDHLRKQ